MTTTNLPTLAIAVSVAVLVVVVVAVLVPLCQFLHANCNTNCSANTSCSTGCNEIFCEVLGLKVYFSSVPYPRKSPTTFILQVATPLMF
jgi:hypothetical protein